MRTAQPGSVEVGHASPAGVEDDRCDGVLWRGLALAVPAVVLLVVAVREYGGPWWKDYSVYLVLAVPLVPALIGGWLVRRTRHGKNR